MKTLHAPTAIALALGLLTISGPLFARSLPSTIHLRADNPGVFTRTSVSADGEETPQSAAFVVQGHSAEMIVDNSALITASEGSRISVRRSAEGVLHLILHSGHFRVLAGDGPIQVHLPSRTVPLTDTEAAFAHDGTGWSVTIGPPAAESSVPPFQPLIRPRLPERAQIGPPELGPPPRVIRDPRSDQSPAAALELEEIEIEADCVEICIE